jgi:hypothetical protein
MRGDEVDVVGVDAVDVDAVEVEVGLKVDVKVDVVGEGVRRPDEAGAGAGFNMRGINPTMVVVSWLPEVCVCVCMCLCVLCVLCV